MKGMRSIGNKSIFGEYSMDENRVTAALLHIIRLCGIELVKELSILTSNHIRYSNSVLVFRFQSGIQNRTLLQESRDIQQLTN